MPVCEVYECIGEIIGVALPTLLTSCMVGMWALAGVLLVIGRHLK